jgi:hypothetical protein
MTFVLIFAPTWWDFEMGMFLAQWRATRPVSNLGLDLYLEKIY